MTEAARSLELGLVGNSNLSALIDERGTILWLCLPRADGDPVFSALLGPDDASGGFLSVELDGFSHAEQAYLPNTPVLRTRLYDSSGGAIEIVDFAPRFRQYDRLFSPAQLVRRVRPISGSPRVRVRIRPTGDYGRLVPDRTWGSNHLRYASSGWIMRLTTDASITALVEESAFMLQRPFALVLGPDETLQESVAEVAERFEARTVDYWHDWVRDLSIPFEWQDEIIRAAITIKLAAFDDTGAVIAAPTTSIPESASSGRNWDYRFCWLRDAYFVVNALNRLNATRTMERYIGYIINLCAQGDARLQPVYRVSGSPDLPERVLESLPGYRGMGPVREGNQAAGQVQNDVYGSAVLAATHAFFDRRLHAVGGESLYRSLEALGRRAVEVHAAPDAGLWELRGRAQVHTFSSVMCWAACDRLAKIGARLGLVDRAAAWSDHAAAIRAVIERRAWNAKRSSFAASFEGETLDASLLLLPELGFLRADDPRFLGTLAAIEQDLRRGDFVFRYAEPDDFGAPSNAFLVCTFWYVDALAAVGRREEARALFERLLARRTRLGLLAEHIDPASGELWGNFPQTYSMVGLINSATRLSIAWEKAF